VNWSRPGFSRIEAQPGAFSYQQVSDGAIPLTQAHRPQLDEILNPSSIAVVGVSENRGSPGSLIYRAIKGMGFEGHLYPVNRRSPSVNGAQCFPSISDIPEKVDLVFVAIPPRGVPSVVRECVTLGVPGCVINSAGFSETGDAEGLRLEEEVLRSFRDSATRIIGPNCLGFYSSKGKVAFFDNMKPRGGGVSMMSQSGSVSTFSYFLAQERNVHFSTIVSSGNELDVNCSELLEYFISDPGTSVILAYLEELREPHKFLRLAREARRKKPIIACKSGLTESGGRAAMSHTGALGGSLKLWQGAAAQAHLVVADDLGELIDLASLFTHLPVPAGRKVAILSSPGGLAVIAADQAEIHGLEIPLLSESTSKKLDEILPLQGISTANPVDLGFGALTPGVYEKALRILDEDPSIDLIVALGGAPSSAEDDKLMFKYFTEETLSIKDELKKPMVVVLLPSVHMGSYSLELHREGIPAFLTVKAAFKSLSRFVDYHLSA
jgi:acyl-CoA synthetase (NDP forming)